MKTKFLLGSLVIVASLVTLVATSMKSATLRAVPVHEVRAADNTQKTFVGQRLRLVGFVARAPVRRSTQPSERGAIDVAHFAVEDKGRAVQVTYRDALPDTFRAGGPVQVDGVYNAAGQIQADHVLTKCPSKYDQMPPVEKPDTTSANARQATKSTPGFRPVSIR